LRAAGFEIRQRRSVSFFRVGALKRLLGAKTLAAIDGALQRPLAPLALSPSVFVQCEARRENSASRAADLFKCPDCGSNEWAESPDVLTCANGHGWSTRDGVYDFRGMKDGDEG
jgi:hypothetical protein